MMVVITGGSGSGKSAYAEDKILSFEEMKRYYIATMYCFDEESKKRVKRHRDMRAGKGFETIEQYLNLKELDLPSDSCVLLECMSNLVANEMFMEKGAKDDTVKVILDGVKKIKNTVTNLVIVTNEIFSDGLFYEKETENYQRCLGEINQGIAAMADEVIEVVYGIPVIHKGDKV